MKKVSAEYENFEIFTQSLYQEIIKEEGFDDIIVFHNKKLLGKSGVAHQIDVYWEKTIGGAQQIVCIECKNWKRRVAKKDIMAFKSVLDDLSATGIYITKKGYQSGAVEYAKHHNIKILTGDYSQKVGNAWMEITMPQLHNINVKLDEFFGIYTWDDTGKTPSPENVPIYDGNGSLAGNLDDIFKSFEHDSDGDYLHTPDNLFVLGDDGFKKIHQIEYSFRKNPILSKPIKGTYNFIEAIAREVDGLVRHHKNLYNIEN